MISDALYDLMDSALRKALANLQANDSSAAIVDLFLQPNPEAGEFSVLDDEDHLLIKVPIALWQEQYETVNVEDEFLKAEITLKKVVQNAQNDGLFESLNILKPFSVLMVNDEMDTLAELLLIDDEQIMMDDSFLNSIDQELNDFYEKLMSGI